MLDKNCVCMLSYILANSLQHCFGALLHTWCSKNDLVLGKRGQGFQQGADLFGNGSLVFESRWMKGDQNDVT